jgi:beta-glucosidase
VAGGPVSVEQWYNDVPAILQTFYNGMEGGNALARLLFGDVNPGGKLPFTVPVNESDLPPFNSFAREVDYGYYHGYTLFDKEHIAPRFSFGFGLSYTTFRFSNLKVLTPDVKPGESLHVSVEVENAGERAGAEVTQLYIGFPQSQVDRPVKILRGFKKTFLLPHEKQTLYFDVKPDDLAYYNEQSKSWQIENVQHEIYMGNSSSASSLQKASFNVSGF